MKLSKIYLALLGLGLSLHATILFQGFDDVTTLGAAGWVQTNNSSPLGATGWFQGNSLIPAAQSGAATSYIAANFLNTADPGAGGGNISNWLITPVVTLDNDEVFSFYTGTESPNSGFADNLEVRMSTNGSSTDVGTTATSVDDFSTLLLSVNPTLAPTGYPAAWTFYQITISGLSGPTSGRLAFRYFVPDTENNGDFIGIDTVNLDAVPEPGTAGLLMVGLIAGGAAYGRSRRNRA